MILDINGIVIAAQRAQLENPTRACVNSESAFVQQRLCDQGFNELAKQYWSFVCGGKDPGFSDEVKENEKKLKMIDKQFEMPSWGTYGT